MRLVILQIPNSKFLNKNFARNFYSKVKQINYIFEIGYSGQMNTIAIVLTQNPYENKKTVYKLMTWTKRLAGKWICSKKLYLIGGTPTIKLLSTKRKEYYILVHKGIPVAVTTAENQLRIVQIYNFMLMPAVETAKPTTQRLQGKFTFEQLKQIYGIH